MKKPEIPSNEGARLNTLRSLGILDSPQEERFNRLTRTAKRLFNVPIAIVSLVDESRQWFKSCVGLDVSETPRNISFCGHTILGDEIFIIPDATKDKRFSDNPLVINEPKIRFYAGCPLKALNGLKLGTLCIIDQSPRTFDAGDMETLRDIASMVENELSAMELATRDDLTQLSNRRGFYMLAEHGLNLCAREDIPASLIYFDLNNFKPINDQFGHQEGDRVLKIFADTVSDELRDSDLFARIGGDEFVALLINSSKRAAEKTTHRLQSLLERFNQISEHDYTISFSCGIVDFNEETHTSVEQLINAADTLMYEQKKARAY